MVPTRKVEDQCQARAAIFIVSSTVLEPKMWRSHSRARLRDGGSTTPSSETTKEAAKKQEKLRGWNNNSSPPCKDRNTACQALLVFYSRGFGVNLTDEKIFFANSLVSFDLDERYIPKPT